MARQNLILGLQAFSAIGIFALGLLTCFGQSSRDLRLEMRQGFESIRVEMREEFAGIRKELREVNTRLSRVEGHLGMPPVQTPVP